MNKPRSVSPEVACDLSANLGVTSTDVPLATWLTRWLLRLLTSSLIMAW